MAALKDVLARQAAVVVALAGRPVHLRAELIRLAAAARERITQDGLRSCSGVDVGGVERRDAGVERGSNTTRRGLRLDLRSVGDPVAVRDLADDEAALAEVSEFHEFQPMTLWAML